MWPYTIILTTELIPTSSTYNSNVTSLQENQLSEERLNQKIHPSEAEQFKSKKLFSLKKKLNAFNQCCTPSVLEWDYSASQTQQLTHSLGLIKI